MFPTFLKNICTTFLKNIFTTFLKNILKNCLKNIFTICLKNVFTTQKDLSNLSQKYRSQNHQQHILGQFYRYDTYTSSSWGIGEKANNGKTMVMVVDRWHTQYNTKIQKFTNKKYKNTMVMVRRW